MYVLLMNFQKPNAGSIRRILLNNECCVIMRYSKHPFIPANDYSEIKLQK